MSGGGIYNKEIKNKEKLSSKRVKVENEMKTWAMWIPCVKIHKQKEKLSITL